MEELLDKTVEIKKSDLRVLELPFNSPVHLPFGKIDTRPSAWLALEVEVDGNLVIGAAEGTALPLQIPMYDDYSGNLENNIANVIDGVQNKKIVLGELSSHIESMDLGGNFATARMTVEVAMMDAAARADNRSVVSYLDGMTSGMPRKIPYGKSIAESRADKILLAAEQAVQNGAKRLKFKVSPENYHQLYPSLKEIIATYPAIDCMVDANGMFDAENEDHIMMLRSIDSLRLLTIEEPVSRVGRLSGLVAHRALASVMRFDTPITMDDAIKTTNDARAALEEDLASAINLKPGRMGSFVKCIEMVDYAKSQGAEVMVGGMFEATPGRMMTLSLASYCLSKGFKIPGDVSLPQERLSSDLVDQTLYLDEQNDVVFTPHFGWGYDL